MLSNSKMLFSEESNIFQQLEQQAPILLRWRSQSLSMIDFKIWSEFSNLKYTFPYLARIVLIVIFICILANNNLLFIKTKLIFLKLVFSEPIVNSFFNLWESEINIFLNNTWIQFLYCFKPDNPPPSPTQAKWMAPTWHCPGLVGLVRNLNRFKVHISSKSYSQTATCPHYQGQAKGACFSFPPGEQKGRQPNLHFLIHSPKIWW